VFGFPRRQLEFITGLGVFNEFKLKEELLGERGTGALFELSRRRQRPNTVLTSALGGDLWFRVRGAPGQYEGISCIG
jgi:hypothetical protein